MWRGQTCKTPRAKWAAIFAPANDLTRAPSELRKHLLLMRLGDADPVRRLAALDGLRAAIGTHHGGSYSPSWDDVDGELEFSEDGEIARSLSWAWDRLMEMSGEPDATVQTAAREIVAAGLRAAVHSGMSAARMRELAALVAAWSPS